MTLIDSSATPEVLEFVRASGRLRTFATYVSDLLVRFAGEISLPLIVTVRDYFRDRGEDFPHKELQNRLAILLKALPIYEAKQLSELVPSLDELFVELETPTNNAAMREKRYTALYFILDALMSAGNEPLFMPYLYRLARMLAKETDWKHWQRVASHGGTIEFSRDRLFERILLRSTRPQGDNETPNLVFDLGRAFAELSAFAKPVIVVANRADSTEPNQYLLNVALNELELSSDVPLKAVGDVLRMGLGVR